MRHISQRFRNLAEIPLLWKEFTLLLSGKLSHGYCGELIGSDR